MRLDPLDIDASNSFAGDTFEVRAEVRYRFSLRFRAGVLLLRLGCRLLRAHLRLIASS